MGTRTEVRRGRPKKSENREKLYTYSVKLTQAERNMLESLRYSTGRSRADILREALRDLYEEGRDERVEYDYFDDFEDEIE